MNGLERRLVELNDALLKMSSGQEVDSAIMNRALQVLSGAIIDTGSGNDTIIINQGANTDVCDCPQEADTDVCDCPQEPPRTCVCDCSKVTVSHDYTASANDHYIGVNADNPVTITLPDNCVDSCSIIVKAEMGPPLGNRKVTIITGSAAMIDGNVSYVMTVPYQSVTLICNDGNWWVI